MPKLKALRWWIIGLVMLGVLGLGLLLARAAARRIAGSLHALNAQALALREGSPLPKVVLHLRESAEVGAVLVVGGNIAGHTRTMTTAISLETQKGDLPLALALGMVLLALVLVVNAAAAVLRAHALRRHG